MRVCEDKTMRISPIRYVGIVCFSITWMIWSKLRLNGMLNRNFDADQSATDTSRETDGLFEIHACMDAHEVT